MNKSLNAARVSNRPQANRRFFHVHFQQISMCLPGRRWDEGKTFVTERKSIAWLTDILNYYKHQLPLRYFCGKTSKNFSFFLDKNVSERLM